jgi:hypothetical protein
MTQTEFEYIKRAVQAIESGELNMATEAKVLRTVGQICEKAAKKIDNKLVDNLVA